MRLSVIRFCCIVLLTQSCSKPDLYPELLRIPLHNRDLLTGIHVDAGDHITILGGNVWNYCNIYTGFDPLALKKDSFSNKLLFDLREDSQGRLLTVGVDGYLYSKQGTDSWQFHRSTGWDILHVIRDTGNGIIAGGGKSYQKGYLYYYSRQLNLDSVQYFDFEISDFVNIGADTLIAAGYGRVIKTNDRGVHWQTLSVRGDFFASIYFIDERQGWIAGYNGTLMETLDGGDIWHNVSSRIKGGGINSFRKLVKAGDMIVLLGNKGKLWYSKDSGQSWTYIRLDTDADLYDLGVWQDKWILVGSLGFVAMVEI